jgi:hypothetical protein
MIRNQRFIPILYNTQDKDGKPWLGIKLIPRSGSEDATIELGNEGKTRDLSVRLAECPIARVVGDGKLVGVAQVDKDGKGLNTVRMERRGVVKCVLRETYVMPDGRKVTMVTDGERYVLCAP